MNTNNTTETETELYFVEMPTSRLVRCCYRREEAIKFIDETRDAYKTLGEIAPCLVPVLGRLFASLQISTALVSATEAARCVALCVVNKNELKK